MTPIKKCQEENCIPTLTSCNKWNGGSIEYLGICNGDDLNTLLWEVISKLQESTGGVDLSEFDIDGLLTVCNQNTPTPTNTTIVSILNIIKNNELCLKSYIDTLTEQISLLLQIDSVSVNLKCYAELDNLGNTLAITRASLDQLVIDKLCNHETNFTTINGRLISLQTQINELDSSRTVEELQIRTCVNPNLLPTSRQVVDTAQAHCDLETATGDAAKIAVALSNTPDTFDQDYALVDPANWIPAINRVTWADNYNNLLIAFGSLTARVKFMEENCCAATCEDVKIGFSVGYNETFDGIIIRFNYGSGTIIPQGFSDKGSTVSITDEDGNVVQYNLEIVNNLEEELSIVGLNTIGELFVSVNANMGTDTLLCQKCISRVIKALGCNFCTFTATGTYGEIGIIYESDTKYGGSSS